MRQFEDRLSQLEQAAQLPNASYAQLLPLAEAAASAIATVLEIDVLLLHSNSAERIQPDGRAETLSSIPDEYRNACSTNGAVLPHRLKLSGETQPTGATLLTAAPLAEDTFFCWQCQCENPVAPEESLHEGARAIADVLSGFVSRHLLTQYEQRLKEQASLVHLAQALASKRTLEDVAALIAHDGPACLGNASIAVIAAKGTRPKLQAVSGVGQPNPQAELSIGLTEIVAATDPSEKRWRPLSEFADVLSETSRSQLQQSGERLYRVLPLEERSTEQGGIVLDIPAQSLPPHEAHVEQFATSVRPALLQHTTNVAALRLRKLGRWLVGIAATALLLFWPVDFEIEVTGQLQAEFRQHVFAPEDGVISDVYFSNETSVESGSPLLKITNSDRNLQLQELLGEVETAAARLTSVEAVKLAGTDPMASANELLLKAQLDNLRAEVKLKEQQLDALNVKAPATGRVFRQDPQVELERRPVVQGQLLLDIVPEDSDWQLELNIPDRARGYITNAQAENKALRIRYQVWSDSGTTWASKLETLEEAVQLRDGKLVSRATGPATELPADLLRPGSTVTARILCGRRSVGFVWFREVVEMGRDVWFSWF